MTDARDLFVVIVGTFVTVGLSIGVVGFLSATTAESRFLDTAAGGAEQFGPVAVEIAHFGALVTVLFCSPILAAALGVLSGARLHDRTASTVVAGGGALVGFTLLASIAIVLTNLGTAEGTAPLFSQPLLFGAGAVVTGLTGAVSGLLGSVLY